MRLLSAFRLDYRDWDSDWVKNFLGRGHFHLKYIKMNLYNIFLGCVLVCQVTDFDFWVGACLFDQWDLVYIYFN